MSFGYISTYEGLYIANNNIDFHLLSGIPGSGKTSLVNAINKLPTNRLLAVDLDEVSHRDSNDQFILNDYELFHLLANLPDSYTHVVLCGINDNFADTCKRLPYSKFIWIDYDVDKVCSTLQNRLENPIDNKWWSNKYKDVTITKDWINSNMPDKALAMHDMPDYDFATYDEILYFYKNNHHAIGELITIGINITKDQK